jgi:HEAT repeat protein
VFLLSVQIISPILRALADENEYVRETAYKAGQRLVTAYADTAITTLLPELEMGLFDDNWRIRHSSIQLLGESQSYDNFCCLFGRSCR